MMGGGRSVTNLEINDKWYKKDFDMKNQSWNFVQGSPVIFTYISICDKSLYIFSSFDYL